MAGVNAGFVSFGYNEDCLTCENVTGPKITLLLKNKKGTKLCKISFIVLFFNW